MSIISVTKKIEALEIKEAIKLQSTEERILSVAFETMFQINLRNEESLKNYQADIKGSLSSGIFYPQDYYKKRDHFYVGLAPKDFFDQVTSPNDKYVTGYMPFDEFSKDQAEGGKILQLFSLKFSP